MSPLEINKFQRIAGRELASFGYDFDTTAQRAASLGILSDVVCGVPRRIAKVLMTAMKLNITARFGLGTDAAGKGAIPASKESR